jgi:hypothetical protein
VHLAVLSYCSSADWRTRFLGDLQQEWLSHRLQSVACDQAGRVLVPLLEAPGLSAAVLPRSGLLFDSVQLGEVRLRSGETVEITLP